MDKKKKAAFITFGCKINIFDTEIMQTELEKSGYGITRSIADADVVVLNSCTVTEKADEKFLRALKNIRKKNPTARIVAAGCYTELHGNNLKNESLADIIVGNVQKFDIADLLDASEIENEPIESENDFRDYEIKGFKSKTRAFLKIQDGCDNFCTYCTIPKARGKSRSKPLKSIVRDIQALVDSGITEIVLSGIDLGSYKDGDIDLAGAISEMLKVKGYRLRISSVEPWCFTDKLIELCLTESRICPHFHIPLQAGSDKILKKMGRHYTLSEFDSVVQKLSVREGALLATDIIVGFPFETDDDFHISLNYLKNNFNGYAHVFSYSDRPLAVSRKFPNKVDSETIKERSRILREISDKKKREFFLSNVGKELEVIVEKVNENNYFGHTENYIPVLFYDDKEHKRGDKVKIILKEDNIKG